MRMLDKYKEFVDKRPFVKPTNPELLYAAAAMSFEAGEAGDCIKKYVRDDDVYQDIPFLLECGDVLYYMTKGLSLLGFTLEDAIHLNQKKLELREELGKVKGDNALYDYAKEYFTGNK